MSLSWEERAPAALDGIDALLDVAYFVPLSIGDALAVQLKVETLRGLPASVIASVFRIMEEVEIEETDDGQPDAPRSAANFFARLAADLPEVYERWAAADRRTLLDPVGAFNLALARASEFYEAWLAEGPETIHPSQVEEARRTALVSTMNRFSPDLCPDDRNLRGWLRRDVLPAHPAWLRPGLYLDGWAEFVRAVMDRAPLPETHARWPY